MVQMVGKLDRDIVEKCRFDDGSLSIPVPRSDMTLNIVDRCRHLRWRTATMCRTPVFVRKARREHMDRWRSAFSGLGTFLPR